ncbi:MAG TPA: EndoU domain-containing protein [Thermoanaerobaculia bacterium]|nr:EndoU domain-containing protein [Thermoanaerobaculia bacterium]
MRTLRPFLTTAVLILGLLLLSWGEAFSRSSRRPAEEWSRTSPPVNLTHIFEGEINKRGKPVGFHSRPAGQNPANARVVRVVDRPNRLGVYTAEVEIRSGGGWLAKRSTFYPDRMDRAAVVQAILNAFAKRAAGGSEKFRGPSGRGFTIEGYYQNGRINTAYPIFARD